MKPSKFQYEFINSIKMLYKLKHFAIIYFGLIIFAIIHSSYQQYTVSGTNLKHIYEYRILSNTIQRFWHNVNVDCTMNTTRLIQIYDKLLKKSDDNIDLFDVLLRHHIKKSIILELDKKIVKALYNHSIKTLVDYDLIDHINDLSNIDEKLKENILDFAINKVFIFIDLETLIVNLIQFRLKEIHILTVEKILDYYRPYKTNTTILPLLTFYFAKVYENNKLCISCDQNVYALYNRLPLELRLLYESLSKTIVLLNQAHLGYLPLMEASERYFRVLFISNREGLTAFGKEYGEYIKYLGFKNDRLAFYGKEFRYSSAQLWYVIWPEYLFRFNNRGFVMFQNKETKMLLCANKNYYGLLLPNPKNKNDEHFFVQLNAEENMLNTYCYWMFKNIE